MASWQVETWPQEDNGFSASLEDADVDEALENVWSSATRDRDGVSSDEEVQNDGKTPAEALEAEPSQIEPFQAEPSLAKPVRKSEHRMKLVPEELPVTPSQVLPDSFSKALNMLPQIPEVPSDKKTKLLLDSSPGSRKAYNNLMMNTSKRPSLAAVHRRASDIAAGWRFWRPRRKRHQVRLSEGTPEFVPEPLLASSELIEPRQSAVEPSSGLRDENTVPKGYTTPVPPAGPSMVLEFNSLSIEGASTEGTGRMKAAPSGDSSVNLGLNSLSIEKQRSIGGATMGPDLNSLPVEQEIRPAAVSAVPAPTKVPARNMYFEPLIPSSRSESPADDDFGSFIHQ